MYNPRTFASNLKRLRGERNLTAIELADKIGVTDGWIYKYENPDGSGKYVKYGPRIDIIVDLAEALDVGVDELVYGRY